MNYFNAVKARWPQAWEYTGRGSVLPKTNGFNGFIRFLRDVYLYVTAKPRLVTQDEFAAILARPELVDADFNVDRFKPGSSGSAELYRTLMQTLSQT